jgi:hypothetical protein
MRFAYADPPYLGQGARWYGAHHPDAAVWDDPTTHTELVARLIDEYPEGWAVSLSTPSLQLYLAACPSDVRVGAWVKPWHQYTRVPVQYAWEPVIWRGGHAPTGRRPWVRDWHHAGGSNPAHGRQLPGVKPAGFNRWVLDLLGVTDDDTLDDLYPGTHGMARALDHAPLL